MEADWKQAWEEEDYETVIDLLSEGIDDVTDDLAQLQTNEIQQLCEHLYHRHEAYKAIGRFHFAVADADRIIAILHRFRLDSNFDSMKPLKGWNEHNDLHEDNERGRKRVGGEHVGTPGHKAKRRKTNKKWIRQTLSLLPTELIALVASFLEPGDTISLANTCSQFRGISQLWEHLCFRRVTPIPETGWHPDTIDVCVAAIRICRQRSNENLKGVYLKGHISFGNLAEIFEALKPSWKTLKSISIPTLNQKLCYQKLYRKCPRLESIDVRVDHRCIKGSPTSQSRLQGDGMFPGSEMPFKLKIFKADLDRDCGVISKHMRHLEVVEGVCVRRQTQPGFIQGLISVAPNLREWKDVDNGRWYAHTVRLSDFGAGNIPTQPIVFPKLLKVCALWSEHFFKCEFPALEEARFNAMRVGRGRLTAETFDACESRISANISKSPSLKKLELLLPSDQSLQKNILTAVASLEHLEELRLWCDWPISLRALIDIQMNGNQVVAPAKLMCGSLKILGLFVQHSNYGDDRQLSRELTELLITRFLIQQGCRRKHIGKRVHAAMMTYKKDSDDPDKGETKKKKPTDNSEKKRLMSEVLADVRESNYPGEFEVDDEGVKRELFSLALLELEICRDMLPIVVQPEDKLLRTLIDIITEIDTTERW